MATLAVSGKPASRKAPPRPAPALPEGHAPMNDCLPQSTPQRRRLTTRLLIGGACTAVLAVASVAAGGIANAEADRTITSNSTGSHNGFFYSYWKDSGNVSMTLGASGNY